MRTTPYLTIVRWLVDSPRSRAGGGFRPVGAPVPTYCGTLETGPGRHRTTVILVADPLPVGVQGRILPPGDAEMVTPPVPQTPRVGTATQSRRAKTCPGRPDPRHRPGQPHHRTTPPSSTTPHVWPGPYAFGYSRRELSAAAHGNHPTPRPANTSTSVTLTRHGPTPPRGHKQSPPPQPTGTAASAANGAPSHVNSPAPPPNARSAPGSKPARPSVFRQAPIVFTSRSGAPVVGRNRFGQRLGASIERHRRILARLAPGEIR